MTIALGRALLGHWLVAAVAQRSSSGQDVGDIPPRRCPPDQPAAIAVERRVTVANDLGVTRLAITAGPSTSSRYRATQSKISSSTMEGRRPGQSVFPTGQAISKRRPRRHGSQRRGWCSAPRNHSEHPLGVDAELVEEVGEEPRVDSSVTSPDSVKTSGVKCT
jgi:hypothetical protein